MAQECRQQAEKAFSPLDKEAWLKLAADTECRALADECFQWARDATTESVRLIYLDIAKGWLELAARQDGGSPTSQPPTDPKH